MPVSRAPGLIGSFAITPVDKRIGASTLFKSWAMPPASRPMPSMRCARRKRFCEQYMPVAESVLSAESKVDPEPL